MCKWVTCQAQQPCGICSFSLLFVSYYKTYKSTQTLMLSLKFLHAEVPFSTDAAVPVHLTPFSLLLERLLETVIVEKTECM